MPKRTKQETGIRMNEKPIIFTGESIRAIMEGRKTQTRRVVKRKGKLAPYVLPDDLDGATPIGCGVNKANGVFFGPLRSPYGSEGGRLWIRETLSIVDMPDMGDVPCMLYAADERIRYDKAYDEANRDLSQPQLSGIPVRPCEMKFGTVPSIFMPRWASRITLEVASIRIDRVQDISEDDALSEGITMVESGGLGIEGTNIDEGCAIDAYQILWDSINSKRGYPWSSNPWVWVTEFKQVKP